MPIKPYQVGTSPLFQASSRVGQVAQFVDHMLVHRMEMVRKGVAPNEHYAVMRTSYERAGFNEFEVQELIGLYQAQGWGRVSVNQQYDAQLMQHVIDVVLHPPAVDAGLVALIDQVKEFVGERPVKMLTRKDNSRHDSGVAYQRPDLSATAQHVLDLHLSDHGTHVVAASSTRPKRLLASQ